MNEEKIVVEAKAPIMEEKPQLVTVELVWKKAHNGDMLIRYGKDYYIVKNWNGKNVFSEADLKKLDRPYPFASKMEKILPTPQEIQSELYRTGIVKLSDVNPNNVTALFRKMIDPVAFLEKLIRG